MEAHAVREQLDRILASAAFATAGRHSRLLRYLVERTLAGEGDQLKEYVLGTEVFDRADSYDPRIDSIVRVEVRRLRSRLEDYYRIAGAQDPVLISIPRGSYIPMFDVRRARPTARTMAVAAVGAALVFFAALAALYVPRSETAQASNRPGLAVLPFETYSQESHYALMAAQLTDSVTTDLARLGTVSVVSRTSAAQFTGRPRSISEIAKTLAVDYIVEASLTNDGDPLKVAVRLVDGRTDRKIWVGEYRTNPAQLSEMSARIASETAAALLAARR